VLVEHLLLLAVELADGLKHAQLPPAEPSAPGQERVDEAEVPLQGAQQLADQRPHLVRRAFLRPGHRQVGLVEHVPVGAGMALPSGPEPPVQKVDHGVGLLPRLVEEREVLGEADVHGRAGRVQDHRPAVGVGGVA